MDLIIGGAYQGKEAYARAHYGLQDEDVFICSESGELDASKRCICHLEQYVLFCIREGIEPAGAFREDAVILCNDISCGVVSMDLVQAAATALFLWFLSQPMLEKLDRIKVKYGLVEPEHELIPAPSGTCAATEERSSATGLF